MSATITAERPDRADASASIAQLRSSRSSSKVNIFLIIALWIFCGCSKSTILSPKQFTKEFAEELRKASPGAKVEIIRDLELKVTLADGRDLTSFLDNAYTMYKQNPTAKADVLRKFLVANLETMSAAKEIVVDKTRIVPVIKDRPWLEEVRQGMLTRGAKEAPENVYEDFTPDLVILYAEDSPKNIRYLTPKLVADAHIDRKELRKLACENLNRLLPKIERHGTNGLFMITAGGDYDASLLLIDSIWTNGQMEVRGDIVVAIPTRDLLLVTGSRDADGIAKVKKVVSDAWTKGSYKLTHKLFVYRDGRFEEFHQ